jgi:hypothetical protein
LGWKKQPCVFTSWKGQAECEVPVILVGAGIVDLIFTILFIKFLDKDNMTFEQFKLILCLNQIDF